jgi:hypothetical protein
MRRSNNKLRCQRRAVPRRLKAEIIARQRERCADCDTVLIAGAIVFDHRPPLALRSILADPNDPDLLAAICKACNQCKTRKDLKEIARAKRQNRYPQPYALRLREQESQMRVWPLFGKSDWT